ncbi:hypothetical protein CEP51_009042 [Fusarium floridanum]|uniref:Protein kinase domain-containing protein n=1 Tax=Fusarium floridanum TaxID=1325733 RepID=A0A428RIY5_9HYPO|nr:hypothetical protein CEP51_009042 [Fusarium floridanum]
MADPEETLWLRQQLDQARAREKEARAREKEARAREKEARAREKEARAREKEARAREEAERREEEEAKAREQAERRKNQKTTLEEYLHNCHFRLYKQLRLADTSKSSTGFTKVEGKYYPKWLRPWTSFMNTQRQYHFDAIGKVCGNRRLFHQESTTEDLGAMIHRRRAGDENAIAYFEELAVEDPVWAILRPLWEEEEIRKEYRCIELGFSHNMRDSTQPSDGDLAREEEPSEGHERRRWTGPNKTKPNGTGVRTHLGGDESLAFVYDYKAAHKVALEYLKPAVANEKLFMEVIERANSSTSRSDAEPRAQEKAEEQIAMALTQVFDHMVRYGVAYGYIPAGKSLLLLHIDQSNPQTLYCHPCVPDEDVGGSSDGGDWTDDKVSYTAVAQLASFCLLSLRSQALRGASLDAASREAEATLRKWSEPYDGAARLIGAEDTDSPPSELSSEATDGSEFISHVVPADRKVKLRSRSSCRAAMDFGKDGKDDNDDDDDDDGSDGDLSRSRAGTDANKRKDRSWSSSSENEGGDKEEEKSGISEPAPTRQYCTQACLLGLKRGQNLDDNCPNVLSHRTAKGGSRHAIDLNEFARLVGEQLRQNPYQHCEALDGWGKVGAIGVLFKLQLAPYGYTFVGKGSLPRHLGLLQHEGHVYAWLDKLQGEVVPVHLGLVRLDKHQGEAVPVHQGYILPGGARILCMMLMSWGGETVDTVMAGGAVTIDLQAEIRRSSQDVWAKGVDHGDERDANRLWNDERRRVMLVDFERATLPRLKHKQLSKVSKKRKRQGDLGGHDRKRFPLGHSLGLAIMPRGPHPYDRQSMSQYHAPNPPSPRLLAIHHAIAHILYLSAAGDYIDDILRDAEERGAREDGSTELGHLARLGLHGWSTGEVRG